MINKHNLPHDTHSKFEALKTIRNEYKELLEELENADIDLPCAARGHILNKIEYINKVLSGEIDV